MENFRVSRVCSLALNWHRFHLFGTNVNAFWNENFSEKKTGSAKRIEKKWKIYIADVYFHLSNEGDEYKGVLTWQFTRLRCEKITYSAIDFPVGSENSTVNKFAKKTFQVEGETQKNVTVNGNFRNVQCIL